MRHKMKNEKSILKRLFAFLQGAFRDMGENAKAQHEVDKANFEAVKAESRANFEENRGRNTLKKAKAQAKQSWDEAHLDSADRAARTRAEQQKQIEEANTRTRLANERYEKARGNTSGEQK